MPLAGERAGRAAVVAEVAEPARDNSVGLFAYSVTVPRGVRIIAARRGVTA